MRRTLIDLIHAANQELLVEGNASAAADSFTEDHVLHLTDLERRGLGLIEGFVKGRIAEEWASSDLAEQLLRARK